ncbi:hypothetical protein GYMLUDRAFT_246544 [Collybiopsis luxurians FD-317 M1]|uniref:Transmembrane protein n=1 Tax=Collybiopsis luxurians FD-317 M1 TaxID=944289 RepID=A0A0D0CHX4_9AGAR|nr:hypothetical protein GYMLUDRAFT_246544 [Collybiopsis luxurians FD-317 M1]
MSVSRESIIVDAYSPLISYNPPPDNNTWHTGGWDGDPLQSQYSNSTFLYSTFSGATATLKFTGTGVRIVGSYRWNDGPYSVTVDGSAGPTNRTGTPPDINNQLFNYVMYDNLGSLSHGLHTVVLTNLASGNLTNIDVDYMVFSTEVVAGTEDQIVQDTEFTYDPPQNWNTDNTNFPEFNSGTVHFTGSSGSTASLNFQGTRIIVYGAVGSAGSPYTAQLDGNGEIFSYNGTQPGFGYRTGQILFYMDNLSNSSHSLTFTALPPSGSSLSFSIDYAITDPVAKNTTSNSTSGTTTASPSGTSGAASQSSSVAQTATSPRNLSAGTAAGIAVGSFATLIMMFAVILSLIRYRNRNRQEKTRLRKFTAVEPFPYAPGSGLQVYPKVTNAFEKVKGTLRRGLSLHTAGGTTAISAPPPYEG